MVRPWLFLCFSFQRTILYELTCPFKILYLYDKVMRGREVLLDLVKHSQKAVCNLSNYHETDIKFIFS